MKYFMGIDVGTNETKGVLIDQTCAIVAFVSRGHELLNPRPGFFEHDAETTWWGDFCAVSRQLLQESGVSAADVGCVGLSALGCDCVPVDAEGTALCNAILYGVDSRSHKEIEWLYDYYGREEAERLYGHELCSSDVAPKILWVKNNLPQVYAKTAKFLTGSSYLCAKLTGEYTIDRYLAEDFAPLYDLKRDTVDEEHCGLYCRPDQLARVMNATDVAGAVTAKAAAQTGLAQGTPVLVGTGDSGAEAISTGVFRPGDIMVQMGSSCYFVYLTDHLLNEPRLWPGTFIIPGVYSVCAGTNTAGTLTRWMRDEFYKDALAAEAAGGENAYTAMVREAAAIPAGSEGLVCLPYFAGERTPLNDPFAKGVFFGLSVKHTRAHMVKAGLEGIAYTIAAHLDLLEKEHGEPLRRIMAVGGGTKNPVWLQAVADVTGRQICTAKVTVGAAFGDAIMAALAGGAYADWDELAKVITADRVICPDMQAHAVYEKQRVVFNELYARNRDLMKSL